MDFRAKRLSSDEAWRTSRERFGSRIFFCAPTIKHFEAENFANRGEPVFEPVSVTGGACQLHCKHCGGIILKTMHSARTPQELYALGRDLARRGCRGLLVSGGADRRGVVPLGAFGPVLKRLKREYGLLLAVHTGLVDRAMAEGLAEAEIDSAMLDIIGSEETIEEIYGLDRPVSHYEESLQVLEDAGVPLCPHIVVGLHNGEILGEYRALEMVARHRLRSLVFVILNPLQGTAMERMTPPAPEACFEVYLRARYLMPHVPMLLGCARPGGEYQLQVDGLFLAGGINGIAYPAEGIVQKARELGLRPLYLKYCCSLIFLDLEEGTGDERKAV